MRNSLPNLRFLTGSRYIRHRKSGEIQLLHTQEVRGSSPCAPTTLQAYSSNRATYVLPGMPHILCFLEAA